MNEPSPRLLVSRRGLMRRGALGAVSVAALASSSSPRAVPSVQAAIGTQPSWTNVADIGPDATGDWTQAFQTAINQGQPLYVPPGTYTCSRGPLVAASWMRIFGNSHGTTTIASSGAHLFDMDNANGLLEGLEIDHLTLSATGGDIFHGANLHRCNVHHCRLIQNSAGYAIWNASAGTGLGTASMRKCCFACNQEYQYGSPRTISAWNLVASGVVALIEDNWWSDGECLNEGHDTTQWWFRIVGPSTGQGCRNNRFEKIRFQYPQGGMIRLESTTGAVIDDVTSLDLASLPVGNPLISIATAAGNATGCSGIAIRSYSRRGGNNGGNGITDIRFDANAAQFIIDTPTQYSGGSILTIDAANATRGTLIGSPASRSLLNASGVVILS